MNDKAFVPLRELVTIVDATGEYLTRDGRRVTVYTVSKSKETFTVKGAIHRECRGTYQAKERMTWHKSGRCYPVLPSPDDIIAKYEEK
ncbi:MAG: hypothetical protein CMF22_12105 [Idiomarinaceae bacterium]|nr:hypothetical protein [Idiomarinaceae bacterium]|tara:strand:+ start:3506 stop:3769 length:264 start_codon:yes stop_codon:yes gene_type:complete